MEKHIRAENYLVLLTKRLYYCILNMFGTHSVEIKKDGYTFLKQLPNIYGYIARRFNNVTSTGAKMDSLADIVFSLVILYYIYSLTQLSSNSYMIIYISLVLVLRIASNVFE